jgi:pimeloyl-ACP methyl ester carboxylesterase
MPWFRSWPSATWWSRSTRRDRVAPGSWTRSSATTPTPSRAPWPTFSTCLVGAHGDRGHSWGGGFGLRFAELYPDRVTPARALGVGRPERQGRVGGPASADPGPRRARGSPDVTDVDTPYAPDVLPQPRAHPRDPDRRRGARDEVQERPGRQVDRPAEGRTLGQLGRHRTGSAPRACSHSASVGWQGPLSPVPSCRPIHHPTAVEHDVLSDCGHSVHDDCPEQTYALLSPFLQESG